MKTKVIMVRHGETDWNVQCKFLGSVDVPLNEKGRRQAGFAYNALKDEHIDVIYTSPLCRAKETGEIIRGERDIPLIEWEGLREIDCGKWEGHDGHEVEELWPGQIELWGNRPKEVRIEGGDTFEEVWERIYEAFWEIVNANRGKTIVITSHMICLQLLMIRFDGKQIEDMWNVKSLANAALNVVEVEEDDRVEILSWSDESFVPEEMRQGEVPVAGKHYRDE